MAPVLPIAALLISQAIVEEAPPPAQIDNPPWSTDLLDPEGITRFNLVGRTTFGDGESVFSSANAWAFDVRAQIRVRPGFSLAAVMPFGVINGHEEQRRVVFGNVGVSACLGGALIEGPDLELHLAGGLDIYAPTSKHGDTTTGALSLLSALRGYDAQLFIPQTLSFRGRGHAEVRFGALTLGGEIGLVPAVSFVRAQDGFLMLLAGAARVSMNATSTFEPYLEAGGATDLGGVGDLRPPFMITPGLRMHIANFLDPAVFVSFNFVEGTAVIFGVDLASAVRHDLERQDRTDPRNSDMLKGDGFLNF